MRALALVNALFAVCLLPLGVFLIFQLGITGLFYFIPGIVFAFVAALSWGRSRAAVVLALLADGPLSYLAWQKLPAVHTSSTLPARLLELAVPAVTLALLGIALVAVLLDWRALRRARWFESDVSRHEAT